jgi:peptide/nickel transport system permease protein
MLQFIVRRLFWIVVTLFVVSVLTFGLVFLTGDPAVALTPVKPGAVPTQAQIEQTRKAYGLDRPVPEQYLIYMGKVVRGDLGESYYFRKPVLTLMLEKLPTTIVLAVTIIVVALTIGIPLGVLAAFRRNTAVDRAFIVVSTVLIAAPPFFLALMMLFFFGFVLKWFPLGGVGTPAHFVLPVLSIALPASVAYALLLRTTILNMLGAEYARVARAKGLGMARTMFKHVLPNALIPVVTVASLDLAILLTGIVLIEQIFGIPGIGAQTYQAVTNRDIPVVMGSVFFGALLIGLGGLLADVLIARLDPRIRLVS